MKYPLDLSGAMFDSESTLLKADFRKLPQANAYRTPFRITDHFQAAYSADLWPPTPQLLHRVAPKISHRVWFRHIFNIYEAHNVSIRGEKFRQKGVQDETRDCREGKAQLEPE